MHDSDHLVRCLAGGGTVRALAVRSTHIARNLARLHEATPIASVALARVSAAALLLGGLLKGREQVSLQLKGNGPLGALYAVADAAGHVRVSIDGPATDLAADADGRWPLRAALGLGLLTVTRSLGLKEPYVGVVPLIAGEVAEDLANYFVTSEQKPAAVAVSEVLGPEGLRVAGGFLIQALPGAAEETLERIEARIRALPPLSTLLAAGESPEAVLGRILDDAVVLESCPVELQCNCSRQRFEALLRGLGAAELTSLAEERENAEVVCHFCNTKHYFAREELLALASGAGPEAADASPE